MKILLFRKKNAWGAPLKALYLQNKGKESYLYSYNSSMKEYHKVIPNPKGTVFGKPQDFVSLVDRGDAFTDEQGKPELFDHVFDVSIDHVRMDKTLIQMVEENSYLRNFIDVIKTAFGAEYEIRTDKNNSECL